MSTSLKRKLGDTGKADDDDDAPQTPTTASEGRGNAFVSAAPEGQGNPLVPAPPADPRMGELLQEEEEDDKGEGKETLVDSVEQFVNNVDFSRRLLQPRELVIS